MPTHHNNPNMPTNHENHSRPTNHTKITTDPPTTKTFLISLMTADRTVSMLLRWMSARAKRVFRDAVQAWDAAGQEEPSPTPNSQSTQDWKSEIEAELNRLRKQAAGASPRASTTASSYRPRTTDAEIEVELSRLKERFR